MAKAEFRLETKRAALGIADTAADGSFSGYASLFGLPDLGLDVIERGAFARALEKRGAHRIRMLWQHDAAQPIGAWTAIREDARGLYVEGRLAAGVARAREALDLLRTGGLDGLSIGFRTVKARKDARTGLRHIVEADLWEISLVTFPMLPEARIASVKARGTFAGDRAVPGAPPDGRLAARRDETGLARLMRAAARKIVR